MPTLHQILPTPPGKREWRDRQRAVGISGLGGSQGLEQSHLILPLCPAQNPPPSHILTNNTLCLHVCFHMTFADSPTTPGGQPGLQSPLPPPRLSLLRPSPCPHACIPHPPHHAMPPSQWAGWPFCSADLGPTSLHPDDDRRIGWGEVQAGGKERG